MRRVFHLILILAATLAAFWAPMGVSANGNDMQMLQMEDGEAFDQSCNGCVSTGFADGILCEGGCPVPCGAGGSTAVIASEIFLKSCFESRASVDVDSDRLTLVGTYPPLDPFPPKHPV